uniref:MORN repeat-containing protein 5 n=1 Tax=Arion vulgaris TaxID=1028688 RepID=A0A0B6Y0V6_9EUPU
MPGDKTEKKKEKAPPEVTSVIYMFPNGDKYEGECIQNDDSIERIGTGTHITATGMTYYGFWNQDKMNGYGKLVHPSSATYEGSFVNNQFHGNGKYTWPNGAFYVGQFVENRIEGDGVFIDTEGQAWTGTFHYKTALGLKFRLDMN